jgi:hypothetical protein
MVKYLVIKNIAYFPDQCALNSRKVMDAVLDVFQAQQIQTQENSFDSDAAVIWSVLWNGRMVGNQRVFNHYRAQNKPVVILDVGALHREITWKISVNHITAQGYYGHQENLDPDRPRKLGVVLAERHGSRPEILVAAQHLRSQQLAGVNLEGWISGTVMQLRQHTDRPIIVRPHPRSTLNFQQLPTGVVIEPPRRVINTYDSFDIDYNFHAVINYNSGPGIQAAIAGAPVIVHETSLAYPVSNTIAQIDSAQTPDRDTWLIEISHTEYTLEEIRRGTWLRRIAPALMTQ